MTYPIAPLPVIDILNELMTIESYLRIATTVTLPPVITQNQQNNILVDNFVNWQQNLWSGFWLSLLSSNVMSPGAQIVDLFQLGVTGETTAHQVFYGQSGGVVPTTVQVCDELAGMVANGQPLLEQLETIAEGLQNADRKQVAELLKQVETLQAQFDEQEDKLTKDALGTGESLVSVVIDLAIAAGTEGDMIKPLIKGITKIGKETVGELKLTSQINKTLAQLESAWEALDEATVQLAQITITCRQIKAVTNDASFVMKGLANLSTDWSTVANATDVGTAAWNNGYSAALNEWANQMILLSFNYTTQTVVPA